MSLAAWVMFALFFGWSAIGMPIGFAMLASSFVYLFLNGGDIGLVASQSLNGLFRSFVLLADGPPCAPAPDLARATSLSACS